MYVQVKGGTNAGRKAPYEGTPYSWLCTCPNPTGRTTRHKLNPGYLVRCPECGERRPEHGTA